MKVLWIDDDAWAIEGLMLPIERSRVHVDIAQDYSEALKKIETGKYDAFIVDLILRPGSGKTILSHSPLGLALIEEIRARDVDVPIVVLSVAVTDPQLAEPFARLGVTVLSKPMLPSGLKGVLLELLEGKDESRKHSK